MDQIAFQYDTPPKVGTTVTYRGQMFTVTETEPYTRKSDGDSSFLVTWRSECRYCGEAHEQRTGIVSNGLRLNCEAHKGKQTAGKQAKAKAKSTPSEAQHYSYRPKRIGGRIVMVKRKLKAPPRAREYELPRRTEVPVGSRSTARTTTPGRTA